MPDTPLHVGVYVPKTATSSGRESKQISVQRAIASCAHAKINARHHEKSDRRSARTRRALRDALVAEIRAVGLDAVTVTAVAERADVTRRTFYSHYDDIADLVHQSEDELLTGLLEHIEVIAATSLDQLNVGPGKLEPCPGSVGLLEYARENGDFLGALLGTGGDPGFANRIAQVVFNAVETRAQHGLNTPMAQSFFHYYVSYVVSAELGVLRQWLEGGMKESSRLMACVMTALPFVRPGDFYGHPFDFDIPMYGQMSIYLEENEDA